MRERMKDMKKGIQRDSVCVRVREREREERMNDKDILLHMIHLDVCTWLYPEKKLL